MTGLEVLIEVLIQHTKTHLEMDEEDHPEFYTCGVVMLKKRSR